MTYRLPTKEEYEAAYDPELVEKWRRALEDETGLDLSDMSARGVVINYEIRRAREES